METRFLEAWINNKHTVYGYRLQPYCLLHSIQLDAIKSPLLSGGDVQPLDVFFGAQICSRNTAEPLRKPSWRHWRYNAQKELDKFDVYVADHQSGPQLYDRPDSTGSCLNSPWQLVVVTTLIRQSTVTLNEAWTMPVGQALWLCAAINEQESGDSSIFSEDLEAKLNALKNSKAAA